MHHSSGEQYTGQWEDNIPHGQGVVTRENGDRYAGQWRAGIPHGRGTATYAASSKVENGWWDNAVFMG